jgi:DUF4097 and DUF4098 domain-containing protein YvlB
MPTFRTPEPITATIDLVIGDARVTASDRDDTVVEVHPSDSSRELDVRAAEQTRVEYSGGRLLVRAPKQRGLGLFGKAGSVDVTIDLPDGSNLEGDAAMATFHGSGRLGECRIKTSMGDIQLEDTGSLDLNTSAGTIVVNHVVGDAKVSTGSGKVRMREIDGSAVIKNSNGSNWIGEIGGALKANTANGDISVDRARADVSAATANGDVRIGEVSHGSVSLKTALGQIEIGIRSGTAARLDVHTSFGRVNNTMDTVAGPESSDATVSVHARTSYGDIAIRRSHNLESAHHKEQK